MIAEAAAAAPWWGTSVIAASAAIAGAVLAFLGTTWRARLDLKHKDLSRWDDLILETAARLVALSSELSESGKVGYPGYLPTESERLDLHIRVVDDWQGAFARFRLVASKDLIRAASRLFEGALTDRLGGPEKMPIGVPFITYETARDEFTVAVRRELRRDG